MPCQVLHNTDAVVAALSFFGQLERLRGMHCAHSRADPVAAHARRTRFDPGQPPSLAERVKQAFAGHNLPIQSPPSLPVACLRLQCPGAVPLYATPLPCAFLQHTFTRLEHDPTRQHENEPRMQARRACTAVHPD